MKSQSTTPPATSTLTHLGTTRAVERISLEPNRRLPVLLYFIQPERIIKPPECPTCGGHDFRIYRSGDNKGRRERYAVCLSPGCAKRAILVPVETDAIQIGESLPRVENGGEPWAGGV